jgi:hypothetical protein
MRGRGGLGRVLPAHEEGEGSDGRGPPGGERGGKGAPDWAKTRELGRWRGFGPCGKERKEGKKKKRWAGWAEKEREKKKAFPFLKLIQTIQFKLKFREFKFEPNNKQ